MTVSPSLTTGAEPGSVSNSGAITVLTLYVYVFDSTPQ